MPGMPLPTLDEVRLPYRVALARRAELPRLRHRLAAAAGHRAELTAQRESALAKLALEQADVVEWSGTGFYQTVASILGRLESRRALEAREAEHAARVLAELCARLEDVERTHAELVAALAEAEREAATVESRREAVRDALHRSEPARKEQIRALEWRQAEQRARCREVERELALIAEVRLLLVPCEAELAEARKLGRQDLIWGGLWTSQLKRDAMVQALNTLALLDTRLAALRRELPGWEIAPVNADEVMPVPGELGLWFDNLFTDLAEQDSIDAASQRVADVAKGLAAVEARALALVRDAEAEIARLEAEVERVEAG